MAASKDTAGRYILTVIYAIAFLCVGTILGIYSYFLTVASSQNIQIATSAKVVEAASAIATIYLIAAVVLALFFAGIPTFAHISMVWDVLFCIAMLAIAVMSHDGVSPCTGYVNTPIGDGPAHNELASGKNGTGSGNGETSTYYIHLGQVCRLNTATFVVSLVGAVLFLSAAGMQYVLLRRHRIQQQRESYNVKQNIGSKMVRIRSWSM